MPGHLGSQSQWTQDLDSALAVRLALLTAVAVKLLLQKLPLSAGV